MDGGDAGNLKSSLAPVVRGIGVLFILGAKGLLGKNQFEDFSVSPVMVFTKCQPMLKQNSYINININQGCVSLKGRMGNCLPNFLRFYLFFDPRNVICKMNFKLFPT